MTRTALSISALLCGVLVACTGPAETPRAVPTARAAPARPAHPYNVLLVTLDTTRADRLGAYGDRGAITPAFDGLAAAGTLFENAYSPCPLTLPAHATLLTGLQPPEHGVRVNGEEALGSGVTTLAEVLAEQDYRTAAFVAAFVVNAKYGLDQGFDVYDDELEETVEQDLPEELSRYRSGDRVVAAALAWLQEHASPGAPPFFVWVHLYDAHYPYQSHPELKGTPLEGKASYDAEVAFADRQWARLLAFLDERRLRERTLVVVAGDHGEGLNDHGEIEHGHLLNEEVLRVPLVLSLPGVVVPGRRVPAIVSLRDVFPTVLDLLGVEHASRGGGRSLAPALRGERIESEPAYGETDFPYLQFRWSPMRSLTTEDWKYVRSARPELYDRRRDRGEVFNLAGARPDLVAKLDLQLARLQAKLRSPAATRRVALSEADRERLEALGYGGAGAPSAPRPRTAGSLASLRSFPDIKDMLRIKHMETDLMRAVHMKVISPERVLAIARKLVEASPGTPRFQNRLGGALMDLGRHAEAVEPLKEALRLDPGLTAARINLARTYAHLGRRQEAIAELRRLLEDDPGSPERQAEAARVHAVLGNLDAALGHAWRALELEPASVDLRVQLAGLLARSGRDALAAEQYRRVLEADPDHTEARFQLARVLARMGRNEEAAAQYTEVLRREPNNVDALNNLGVALAALGRAEEAERRYREAMAIDPGFARPHYNLANLLLAAGREAEAAKHYSRALELQEGWVQPLERLAWLRATAADAAVRSPEEAVRLAERAAERSDRNEPWVLRTLATAYAAAGRDEDARAAADLAWRLARAQSRNALAEEIAREFPVRPAGAEASARGKEPGTA